MPKQTILIVAPDTAVADTVAAGLRFAGFLTLTADDAGAATRLVLTARPDLILIDIAAEGRDGLAEVRQWKTDPETSAVPIIAMSAGDIQGDQARLISQVCAGYYPLTASPRNLLKLLSAILNQSVTRKRTAR